MRIVFNATSEPKNEKMSDWTDRTVVVLGGTGNVGSHIVGALLQRGAEVVVPSRSGEKLRDLEQFLHHRLAPSALPQLRTLIGDLTTQENANRIAERVTAETGGADAVVATIGSFLPARSLLTTDSSSLQHVLDNYLVANFHAARAFLPRFRDKPGKYVWLNGPLAFQPWKNSAGGLVSIAAAGQHMMFRALAQELEGTRAELIELVIYAYVRNRETQPGSAVSAHEVGQHIAQLLSETDCKHAGQSIHMRAPDHVEVVAA